MSRGKFEKTFNTFVKGLMTEASELNFPEDFSLYEKNFLLHRDGGRDRRRGMELMYPLGLVLTSLPYPQLFEDRVQATLEFPPASLIALVKIAGYPEDSASAQLSFPMGRIRTAIEEYGLEDFSGATIEFPQAALRAPLVELRSADATESTIGFPEAKLRHALIENDYSPDATEATIGFPEATLYGPN